MEWTTEKARAKINLFLEVLGKRADGYHEIETVMADVGLSDDVYIELTDESGIVLDCDADMCERREDIEDLPSSDNLAYKAAEEFFSSLDGRGISHGGVYIRISKVIPVRSGLAGGSADAAAVLRGMNTLYGNVFDSGELCALAVRLGADVPFCLVGGIKVCRNIGDEMSHVETSLVLHGVITVEKDKKLSTGDAYRLVDIYNENEKTELMFSDDTVRALELEDTDALCKSLFSVFEKACGYSTGAKKIMMENGASNAVLSGAGSAFFTLCDNAKTAEKIASALISEGYPAYIF